MIENITYKKKLLALIVKGNYRKKKGISFFTRKESTQQFGYMKHKKRATKISYTTEVIILLIGSIRIDFYANAKKYLFSMIIKKNDIIMLVSGGHGFKVLKDVEMIEVKQGPYSLSSDKIKFSKIDEKKIKIK